MEKWKRECQVLVLGSGKVREWDRLSRGRGERKRKKRELLEKGHSGAGKKRLRKIRERKERRLLREKLKKGREKRWVRALNNLIS